MTPSSANRLITEGTIHFASTGLAASNLGIMTSSYDFPYHPKSGFLTTAAARSSVDSEAVSFKSTIQKDELLVGTTSSTSRHITPQNRSKEMPAAIKGLFGSPSHVPQKHSAETDTITRRDRDPFSKTSVISLLCGVESDPITVQLRIPDGSSVLFLVFSVIVLIICGYYIHGKSYFGLLSSNPLGYCSLGLLAGVLSRTLLVSLPDNIVKSGKNRDAYSVLISQSASIVLIASCVTGQMSDATLFFLLGRNVLLRRYTPTTSSLSNSLVTPTAAIGKEKRDEPLLYNSGLGSSRSKQRFAIGSK